MGGVYILERGGKKMKRITIVVLSLLMVMMLAFTSFAVSLTEQASIFAGNSFTEQKEAIAKSLVDMGYMSPQEADISLGKPFLNYVIPIDNCTYKSSDKDKVINRSQESTLYTFPILSGDKIISDYTVALYKGEWQFIDFGGDMTRRATAFAKDNGVPVEEVKLLRAAGQSFIIAKTSKGEIANSPYTEDKAVGLVKDNTVSADKLNMYLQARHKEYIKIKEGGTPVMGSNFGSYPPADFDQNASVVSRLINYIKFHL